MPVPLDNGASTRSVGQRATGVWEERTQRRRYPRRPLLWNGISNHLLLRGSLSRHDDSAAGSGAADGPASEISAQLLHELHIELLTHLNFAHLLLMLFQFFIYECVYGVELKGRKRFGS